MIDINAGDWTRIVLEGEIGDLRAGDAVWIAPDGSSDREGNWIYPTEGHVKSIEKIDRPVRVGDVLSGPELRQVKPHGALVRFDGRYFMRFAQSWTESDGDTYSDGEMDASRLGRYEVVYLP